MVAAGLARPADAERGLRRDFFFNRVMFPIGDGRGRIVAFGGRALQPDAKPKYINSGESALFSKGAQLYNFATARAAAFKAGTILVAEGYMDVIALVRGGFAYCGGAARHRAHRRSVAASVAHRARAHPGLRRRRGRPEGRPSGRASGTAPA